MGPFKNNWLKQSGVRVIVLALAVVFSVGVPYAVLQTAADGSINATLWVAHTETVKSTLFEVVYRLRDLESSALNAYLHTGDEVPVANYRVTRGQVEPLLDQLAALTIDNPSQQVRIGEFKAVAEGCMRLFDTAMQQLAQLDQNQALQSINQAQKMFRFREIANAIAEEEVVLLQERSASAARSLHNARVLSIAALITQLVLFGGMIFLSERQAARRERAENDSRAATLRSQHIVQTIREPIVLLDHQLHLLMHNNAFSEFYGSMGDQQVGRHLGEIGRGAWSDRALLQRLGDVGPHNRELWDYELHQRNGDAAERIVMINARPIAMPDTNEAAVLMTVSDITSRKRAEDEVRELNKQLEGKIAQVTDVNRELEAFSYSVSHDLRAPLRHVAGFSDKLSLLLGPQADEKARHYLDIIGGAARRMSTLIDDLLVYSRLGRHALRLQIVDMQSLVEDTRSMFASEIADRDLEWRITPLPTVIGDENMLRQVWQNLLGNAIKYSAKQPQARIEIGYSQTADEYVFQVSDNGAGFDMQYAGKLFGVFQRLHKASEYSGTGIGLANVRRIVSRHGGLAWAESILAAGATFYFSLPIAPDTFSNTPEIILKEFA